MIRIRIKKLSSLIAKEMLNKNILKKTQINKTNNQS
jgi:hypothetical protein